MSKRVLYFSILLIIITGCINQWKDNTDNNLIKEETRDMGLGSYELYELEKITLAKDNKVVLFFNASWCPSCQMLEKDINDNEIPKNIYILKIDYDTNQELRIKYGVPTQHTLVQVDQYGEIITKWIGGGFKDLINNIK